MPVKKRRGTARAFEDYHRQQLLEGPDAVLLAGVGYLALIRDHFHCSSPEDQEIVLAAMRAD